MHGKKEHEKRIKTSGQLAKTNLYQGRYDQNTIFMYVQLHHMIKD